MEEAVLELTCDSLSCEHSAPALGLPADSFAEDAESVDGKLEPYLDGSYQLAGTVWPVLNIARLMEDPGLEKLG